MLLHVIYCVGHDSTAHTACEYIRTNESCGKFVLSPQKWHDSNLFCLFSGGNNLCSKLKSKYNWIKIPNPSTSVGVIRLNLLFVAVLYFKVKRLHSLETDTQSHGKSE